MKKVEAIISRSSLMRSRKRSGSRDPGLSVTEVKGFGRQKGHTELYRGAE